MYRYILSSDSVISRMESRWYKNLEKNKSGKGTTEFSVYNPLGATYLTLARSLLISKGKYLLKDDVEEGVYYEVSSVLYHYAYIQLNKLGPNVVPNPWGDGLKLVETGWTRICADREGSPDMFSKGMSLPVDGTCPTVVSREEAILEAQALQS